MSGIIVFLFRKKSKSRLGIDIGASAVKIVELEKEEGRHKLKNYAFFSLDDYLRYKGRQIGPEAPKISNQEVAEIIKRMIREAGLGSRETYLSIPVYSSFSTLIDFPAMSDKEIAAAIPFEARKYVPVPMNEVVLDWSIIDLPNKQAGRQVLLIAAPKEIIKDYNEIVRLTGLELKAVEEETFGLSRSLAGNDRSSIVLIDAGSRSINVSVIDAGYVRVTHNLEMGGGKISRAIAQQMNLDFQKAEELKKSISQGKPVEEKDPELKSAIYSALAMIAAEIKKIVDAYQTKYSRKIEKGILTGGAAQILGLLDHLVSKLNIEISLGDPFARVSYPPALKPALKELGPLLAVAVGLAMRE